jgi:hypothetical protein
VLTLLVDDASAVSPTDSQSALGDLWKDRDAMTRLGKRFDSRVELAPFLSFGLGFPDQLDAGAAAVI